MPGAELRPTLVGSPPCCPRSGHPNVPWSRRSVDGPVAPRRPGWSGMWTGLGRPNASDVSIPVRSGPPRRRIRHRRIRPPGRPPGRHPARGARHLLHAGTGCFRSRPGGDGPCHPSRRRRASGVSNSSVSRGRSGQGRGRNIGHDTHHHVGHAFEGGGKWIEEIAVAGIDAVGHGAGHGTAVDVGPHDPGSGSGRHHDPGYRPRSGADLDPQPLFGEPSDGLTRQGLTLPSGHIDAVVHPYGQSAEQSHCP